MMRFLVDTSPVKMEKLVKKGLVLGQLITPLTGYANFGGCFAIDNGAFTCFDAAKFARILNREQNRKSECLFVTVPDIVGNGRRTMELWQYRHKWCSGWPMAFVAQDGIENMDIPWGDFKCLFVGGCDPWKDSKAAADIVKTAKTIGKHVHVGRVNSFNRYKHFSALGADTCDGSGIAKYDHMLDAIERELNKEPHPELEFVDQINKAQPCQR
ncbi:MAG: hypothetical protein HGA87_00835 [Desulfobulbaceae bacterium]|nr:hypothetical protein [Desulfobulbaceae bacterium]